MEDLQIIAQAVNEVRREFDLLQLTKIGNAINSLQEKIKELEQLKASNNGK